MSARTITFQTAVDRGRKAVLTLGRASWTLGDIADQVKPEYGDDTLGKLADALFINVTTLDSYRKCARTYPAGEARETGNGFTVYSIFTALDAETAIAKVQEKIWTVREARAEVAALKDNGASDDNGNGASDDNGNDKTELTLDEQIANAEAEVTRLAGQLETAKAALQKLITERAAVMRAANAAGSPRRSRTRK